MTGVLIMKMYLGNNISIKAIYTLGGNDSTGRSFLIVVSALEKTSLLELSRKIRRNCSVKTPIFPHNSNISIGILKNKKNDMQGFSLKLSELSSKVRKEKWIKECGKDITKLDHEFVLFPEGELNHRQNTKEVENESIFLQSKPIKLGVILTNKCNLDCLMCQAPRKSGSYTLSKKAVDKIRPLFPYLKNICWQGGEVFLVSYLKKIFKNLILFPNIHNEVTTNGLTLTDGWARILVGMNVSISFSVDSVDSELYERIRRPGKFSKLLEKIEMLNSYEAKYRPEGMGELKKSLVVVVMRSNYKKINAFVDFASKYRFGRISFYPVMNVDKTEDIFNDDKDRKIRDYLCKSLKEVEKKGEKSGIEVENYIPLNMDKKDDIKRGAENSGVSGLLDKVNGGVAKKKDNLFCSLPWQTMWIDASDKGNIFIDCNCSKPVGNIYRDDLNKVWNGDAITVYRRMIVDGKADICNKECLGKIFSSKRRRLEI